MKEMLFVKEDYYKENNIDIGENLNNENIKYIMKNMCNQAEMSHAIIAYLYLLKTGFLD